MCEYSLDSMLSRIKKEKKEKHITNEKLAVLTGMPLGTLSKILAGVTKEPSVESIIKISKALDVSADYLIFGNLSDMSNGQYTLSGQEKKLIESYRNHPDMHAAINKMLDIDTDEGKAEPVIQTA